MFMFKHFFGNGSGPETDLEATLSAEAERFLEDASSEFNHKQEALKREWSLDSHSHWGFDQGTGKLELSFENGRRIRADGQILASYSTDDGSWEWAWNNPHVEPAVARESDLVRDLGRRLHIPYLQSGKIPAPGEELVSFLCAIGVKATESVGVYRGAAGPIEVMILLKNPKWTDAAA